MEPTYPKHTVENIIRDRLSRQARRLAAERHAILKEIRKQRSEACTARDFGIEKGLSEVVERATGQILRLDGIIVELLQKEPGSSDNGAPPASAAAGSVADAALTAGYNSWRKEHFDLNQ
jgi:hypothetical protein